MNDKKLTIDIVSDIVCPWCVIGYKNLRIAENILKDDLILRIDWKPYQLHPYVPEEGIERSLFLKNKFGSFSTVNRKRDSEHLEKLGREVGFIFNFKKAKKIPNTLQSHRLIELFTDVKIRSEIVEELFLSYFTEGLNIGLKEDLLKIGKKMHLDALILEKFFYSDDCLDKVVRQEELSREKNIFGVPTFVINDQYLLQGAQEPDTIASFLRRIRDKVDLKLD